MVRLAGTSPPGIAAAKRTLFDEAYARMLSTPGTH